MEWRKLKLEELNRMEVEDFKSAEKIPVTVVLDDIRSALNVGSIFRTADAFRIEKIFLCGITATPPHKEILKTAIGATDSVDWTYEKEIESVLSGLQSEGYVIYGVEQTENSTSLDALSIPQQKIAVILGNEVGGVSDKALAFADGTIEIPQFGTKHSLNVAVCTGIVLWELQKVFPKP
ncbi:MAG: RNA methyltransferase [Saprospiraceae bacterium]|nr:RNA methyltransferase [Saprospiraceae bacterium]